MMMGGVINVELFILLVWTFTAVCEGNEDIMSTCQVFTASIGDEKTLQCDVSYPNKDCCLMEYKFIDSSDNSVVSSEEFSGDSCIKKNSFSYSYPPYKHTTTQFKFYIQTTCGEEATFNVKITDDIIMTCKDVTARVGDKINLRCEVSYQDKDSCVMLYRFIDTSSDNLVIYREEFSRDSCIQKNSFSYSYPANKSMTTRMKFYIQTTHGAKSTTFSVNIAGAVKQDDPDVGGDPNRHENNKSANGTSVQTGIFIAGVICGIVITIIILLIVRKIRNTPRLQRDNNVDVRDNIYMKKRYSL